MLKKDYSRSIKLRCATCGSSSAFEKDPKTGVITCKKCNRIYYGGYNEIVKLNQKLISDEVESTKKEIEEDIQKEFDKIFKRFK